MEKIYFVRSGRKYIIFKEQPTLVDNPHITFDLPKVNDEWVFNVKSQLKDYPYEFKLISSKDLPIIGDSEQKGKDKAISETSEQPEEEPEPENFSYEPEEEPSDIEKLNKRIDNLDSKIRLIIRLLYKDELLPSQKLKVVLCDTIHPFEPKYVKTFLLEQNFTLRFWEGTNCILSFITRFCSKDEERNYVVTDVSRSKVFYLSESGLWKSDYNMSKFIEVIQELRSLLDSENVFDEIQRRNKGMDIGFELSGQIDYLRTKNYSALKKSFKSYRRNLCI